MTSSLLLILLGILVTGFCNVWHIHNHFRFIIVYFYFLHGLRLKGFISNIWILTYTLFSYAWFKERGWSWAVFWWGIFPSIFQFCACPSILSPCSFHLSKMLYPLILVYRISYIILSIFRPFDVCQCFNIFFIIPFAYFWRDPIFHC